MSDVSRAYALSGSNLVSFDPSTPTVGNTIGITGLTTGETLVGIDFRPLNGFLYGLGVNSTTDDATLYAISTRTGVAAAVGTPGQILFFNAVGERIDLPAGNYGFDFNPAVDRIRVTTETGLNFRINPNTGAPVDGDPGSVAMNPDGAIPADSAISGAAYTNNQPNATATTLYTLDSIFDRLQIQNPPNDGTQTAPVVTSVDISTVNGFDIAAGVNVTAANAPVESGSGLALLTVDGTIGFYSVDLVTGAATKVGNFLDGATPASGLAIQNDLGGIPAIALSAPGTNLVRFNTATPGTTISVPISGITVGEMVVGIDFRPQTGQLYAFAVNASANTGTLYLVEPNSGVATSAGPPGQIALVDGAGNPIDLPAGGYGMDFNPTVDRIRITTDTGLNFRINPNTGAPVDGDLVSAGINPDGAINGSGSTGVSATAYTNSYGQSLTGGVTTLYTLDSVSNSLFIQNPANAGTQTAQVAVKLGGSTLDFTSVNAFDIPAGVTVSAAGSPAAGFGFAGLTVGGVSSLYMIDLVSGAATNLGPFGTGATQMVGLALADSPFGAAANDFYFVDDPGDIVVENPNQGFDTVTATIDYRLTPNVEKLVLQGDATTPLQGYGNDLVNSLTGSAGSNLVNGEAGADTMAGGLGDDPYFVDDPNDVVVENVNAGNDTTYSTVDGPLAANVENLVLLGAADLDGFGNDLSNLIYGNAGNNLLDGSAGTDGMVGLGGNDIYVVDNAGDAVVENANAGFDTVFASAHYRLTANVESLVLLLNGDLQGYGNELANTLSGNSGNNVLDGGVGADGMTGAFGDDFYFVDDPGDTVVENAGEGNDAVSASVNVTLAANVEALILTGSADLQGVGNGSSNLILGNGGNNLIDGLAGADGMLGGAGNDVYFVDDAGDAVLENAGAGNDTVYSTAHFRLSENVDNLILQGSADLQGYGNSTTNAIFGNSGVNLLDGGAGADVLTGDAGNDVFMFNAGQGDGDTIVDFAGNGTAAGDFLYFAGYGAGATFANIDATRWQIDYNAGALHEIITFSNAALIDQSDFLFA